jgi:drug/metabolite transporter (DMT)-like permease
MAEGIVLSLLAAGVYSVLGITFESAGKRRYKVWDVIFYKQLVGFGICLLAMAFLPGSGFRSSLLLLGFLAAVAYILTLAAYLFATRERDIATNWTIVNLSVILPILVSLFWFKDPFSLTKAIGLILTLASIVLIGGGIQAVTRGMGTSRWRIYIIIAFFLNGGVVAILRFVPPGSSILFNTYFHGFSLFLLLPFMFGKWTHGKPSSALLAISTAAAVTHLAGIMFTIAALALISRVSSQAGLVVFPITNGLVIPLGVVLGAIVLKQKIRGRIWMGVALGSVAMVFLSLP